MLHDELVVINTVTCTDAFKNSSPKTKTVVCNSSFKRIKVMQNAALTSNAKDHSYYTTQTTLSTICTEA